MQSWTFVKSMWFNAFHRAIAKFCDGLAGQAAAVVPSGMRLEFGLARSPGNTKVSFQAARSINRSVGFVALVCQPSTFAC